jgi:cardiolipin synthase
VFIEEYLQDLRRDRFAPRAVGLYLKRLARRVRDDLVANPDAVRSIWNVALVFFAGTFVAAAAMSLAYDRHLAYRFFLHTALWILVSFSLVTLFIGMLRDREGYRLSALNLPTVLTLLRATLVPGVTLFLTGEHYGLALILFLVASITDVADGWLARRWKQTTRFGSVLDAEVDIVFNLALFGALSASGLLAPWVFWVALARYAILLLGGSYLYVFFGPVRIYPTLFGRLTGVIMAALVAFLLLLHVARGPWPLALGPLTQIALGVLLSATVLQVTALGWYNLKTMSGDGRGEGRVVGDVRWGAR